jgi:hypothetical protein
MDTETLDKVIAHKSAMVYLAITAAAALVFLLASTLIGNYALVAKVGGAVWVSLLTLIVSMPLVTSSFKKKLKGVK